MFKRIRKRVFSLSRSDSHRGSRVGRNRLDSETSPFLRHDYTARIQRSVSVGNVNSRVNLNNITQNYYTVTSFRQFTKKSPTEVPDAGPRVGRNLSRSLPALFILTQDSALEPRSSRARTTITPTTPPGNPFIVQTRQTRDYDYLLEPSDPGIPMKNYLGKYQLCDESDLVDEGAEVFKPRSYKSKKKKPITRILRSSKKSITGTDKKGAGFRTSCIVDKARETKKKRWIREGKPPHSYKIQIKDKAQEWPCTPKHLTDYLQLIVDRRYSYNNLNLNKNACITQLQMSLLETHLFQVDVEKDQAFGLGVYLYAIGPDRLVPYVSIFVKEVIQGGTIDRQGMIKPHDQIIKCGGTSFVGIKQEDALKIMKNKSYLKLTMGRRTKPNNQPMTKQDHKTILKSYSTQIWFKDPHKLESGDFRLLYTREEEGNALYELGTSTSPATRSINIDTHNLSRVQGSPQQNSATAWENRQEYLENQVKQTQLLNDGLMKEKQDKDEWIKALKQEKEEMAGLLRQYKQQELFQSKLQYSLQKKMKELSDENVDLRFQDTTVPDERYCVAEQLSRVRDDLSSLNRDEDDLTSVSTNTIRNHGNRRPSNSLQQMEMLSDAALEDAYINLPVAPRSPYSTGSESTRYTYDSSRRPSAQYLDSPGNRSSILNISTHSLISTEDENECTPTVYPPCAEALGDLDEMFEHELSNTEPELEQTFAI